MYNLDVDDIEIFECDQLITQHSDTSSSSSLDSNYIFYERYYSDEWSV